jgi:hypothetical protein
MSDRPKMLEKSLRVYHYLRITYWSTHRRASLSRQPLQLAAILRAKRGKGLLGKFLRASIPTLLLDLSDYRGKFGLRVEPVPKLDNL